MCTVAAVKLQADAILFDNDGVLVDSHEQVVLAWRQLATEFGLDYDMLVGELVGARAVDTLGRYLSPSAAARAVARLEDLEVELAASVRPMAGALDLIGRLPAGLMDHRHVGQPSPRHRTLGGRRYHHSNPDRHRGGRLDTANPTRDRSWQLPGCSEWIRARCLVFEDSVTRRYRGDCGGTQGRGGGVATLDHTAGGKDRGPDPGHCNVRRHRPAHQRRSHPPARPPVLASRNPMGLPNRPERPRPAGRKIQTLVPL